jgi:hypothetical protein
MALSNKEIDELLDWVGKKYKNAQTRSRLVELLLVDGIFDGQNCDLCGKNDYCTICGAECIADHLFENDVVPVVRCKDCYYANADGTICHYGVGRDTKPDKYCSDGERKDA